MHPVKAVFVLILVILLVTGLFVTADRSFNLTGRFPKDANPVAAAVSEQPKLE